MDYRARIKLLLSLPSYRMRLAFFVVLGGSMILTSFFVVDPFWKDIVVQFAVVFIAVGVVDFVWEFLGGTQLELQMTRDFGEVDAKLDSIHRSMTVLSDIVDRNIGVERIWPKRGVWEHDSVDGLAVWKERVCDAKSVDIVSNTLYTRWFEDHSDDRSFAARFFRNLAHGSMARILIYDPHGDALRRRELHEPGRKGEMPSEIESTLVTIAQYRETLDDAGKRNLQVRLTTEYYHLAQIIRADDKMLIAIYLSGKSGTPTPTLQLRGHDTEYFRTYQEQIKILWQHGREVDDDEFRQILAQGQIQPAE